MANTYKNIVITPSIGSNSADPKIVFSGANTNTNTDITVFVYPTANGTLSFEGSVGQLFSVTNDLSNNIFRAADVSGVPLIDAFANGLVALVPTSGNVGIANTTPAHKLSVSGTGYFVGNVTVGNSSVNASVFSNSSGVYFGGTALTANNANNLNGKAESALNVNNSVTSNTANTATYLGAANNTGNSSGVFTNGTVNALSLSVSTNFIANSTGAYHTGTINAASHTVGSSTIANSSGVYATTINAASHTVGTAFTANSTVVNAVAYYSGTTLIGNSTGPYGKTEGNLNVNNATTAYGKTEGNLNVNNATTAYGKTEGNLNVNSAAIVTSNTSTNTFQIGTALYSIASGNVGIGNSAPTHKLSVNGTGYFGNALALGPAGGGNEGGQIDWSAGNSSFNGWTTDVYTSTFRFFSQGAGSLGNGQVQMFSANTSHNVGLYVQGNTGIGTSSPAYKLDVSGNTNVSDTIFAGGTLIGNSTGPYGKTEGNLNVNSAVRVTTNTTSNTFQIGTSVYFTGTGNTGIGSSTTYGKLTVTGTAVNSAITLNDSDVAVGAWIRNDAVHTVFSTNIGNMYFGYSGSTKQLNFSPGGTAVPMFLNSSGILNLDVAGNQLLLHNGPVSNSATVIHRNDGANYYILLSANSTAPSGTWTASRPLYIDINSGLLYSSNGQQLSGGTQTTSLGVGTASSGTAGEIRATNNITAYYSDKRLKENIEPISNALEKLHQISGVTYNSNELATAFGYTDKSTQVGVLAQEVQEVLPMAVKAAPFDIAKNDDGSEYSKSGENYLTVQYEKLIPLLIEAIKEQQKQIEELRLLIKDR